MPRSRRGNTTAPTLQAQVNRLTQMMASLQGPRSSRSRSRRRGRTPGQSSNAVTRVSAPAATSVAVTRGRSRSRPRPGQLDMGTGTIRLFNREVLRAVKVKANTTSTGDYVNINANDFGFLAKLGALFGRMKWHRISVFYEAMTSANTEGLICYGVDWGMKQEAPVKYETVVVLNPSMSHPLWGGGDRMQLTLGQRLNARLWYDIDASAKEDSTVATLSYFSQTPTQTFEKTYGLIWIEYEVELQGPRM